MLVTLGVTCINALMITNRNCRPYTMHTLQMNTAEMPWCPLVPFHVLGKCITKFDSLITEMLLIANLNQQSVCLRNLL